MCSNYPGIKLEPTLQIKDNKTEHLSSYGHVVHTTAKQVISRRGKNENVYEMCRNEKCTCKACKIIVFYCQIRKFETFLFPSSSWLLKLPNISPCTPNKQKKLLQITYNEISYDHSWNEKRYRSTGAGCPHAVPQRLNPLAT